MTDDRAAQIRSRVADWLTRHRHRRLDCSLFEEQADAILAEVAVLLDWMAASREREIPATIRAAEQLVIDAFTGDGQSTYRVCRWCQTGVLGPHAEGHLGTFACPIPVIRALLRLLLQAQETPPSMLADQETP